MRFDMVDRNGLFSKCARVPNLCIRRKSAKPLMQGVEAVEKMVSYNSLPIEHEKPSITRSGAFSDYALFFGHGQDIDTRSRFNSQY